MQVVDLETIKFILYLATCAIFIIKSTLNVCFFVNDYIKNLIAKIVQETVSKEIEIKLVELTKKNRCSSRKAKQR